MGSDKSAAEQGIGVDFNHPAAAHVEILDRDLAKIDWRGRTKLALVGFASSSRHEAPIDDPEWIILGLNQLYRHIPRADAWMEIHFNWNEYVVEGTDHLGWLQSFPGPIYMAERIPEIPNSVRYPIETAIDQFSDYFTSTVAFGVALSMLEGFKTLGIWGVDLIVGEEYFYQKSCVEYLMGYAMGRGMEIRLPRSSALLKSRHRYGYQLEPDYGPMSMSNLVKRGTDLKESHRQALARAHWLDGRVAEITSLNGSLDPDAYAKRLEERNVERGDHLGELHKMEGAARETFRWIEYLEISERGGMVPP